MNYFLFTLLVLKAQQTSMCAFKYCVVMRGQRYIVLFRVTKEVLLDQYNPHDES